MSTDPMEHMKELFGEMFAGGSPPPPRVLPLVANTRGYRDASEESRVVHFRRRVRCACEGGCRACGRVGWRIAYEKITVKVPAGTTLGTQLRVAGKGDESMSSRAGFVSVSARTGDLHLEIVEPGERADHLTAEARAHDEQLAAEWAKLSDARRAEVRKSNLAGLGILLAIAVFGGILWLIAGGSKVPDGERCRLDSDCRSGRCDRLACAPPR